MTARERAALLRLLAMAAAWALGIVMAAVIGVRAFDYVLPALFAAAVFMWTRARPLGRRDNIAYWRGQRIDRERWH